jgi:transcriptional regulator with XRE-family HTH domain
MEISVQLEYKNTRLKELREQAGLSQSQLSALTGISTRVLQNYEQGVRNLNGAKLVTLLQLCKALGCTLRELVTEPQAIQLLDEIYHAGA